MAFDSTVYTVEEKCTDVKSADLQYIIIDFSALAYVDPSSVSTLKMIAENFQKINICVFIAGCSGMY